MRRNVSTFKLLGNTVFVLLIISMLWMSCLPDIYSDRFTDHVITVRNNTSSFIWIDYKVENQLLDTTMGQRRTSTVFTDSAFALNSNRQQLLFLSQHASYHRFQLDWEDINERIIELEIFKIDGQDTLSGEINLYDVRNWEYTNSDPLPYSSSIYHHYLLNIDEIHFD